MVTSNAVLLEQRLATRAVTGILALVFLIMSFVMVPLAMSAKGGIVVVALPIVVLALLALATAMFSRIDVRVISSLEGPGLEIAYGPGGRVRQYFSANEILSSSAQHLSMLQLGGWGYRGSLKLFRQAALSTRRGDALVLRLTGKRTFSVTVADPAAFVTALSR